MGRHSANQPTTNKLTHPVKRIVNHPNTHKFCHWCGHAILVFTVGLAPIAATEATRPMWEPLVYHRTSE